MPELTAENLVQRAYDLQLLQASQLDSLWNELGGHDAPFEDARNLLLRKELLTNYQMERLLKGERVGFFYGPYKVLYLVGVGSYARVYRAVHRETGRVVAVKVLRRRFREDTEQKTHFIREGEMGTKLRHPNVVPIYEAHMEKQIPFLVMEFVEGQSLRDFVRIRGRLDPLEALRLMRDVAAGLTYAADRGVTHRDLKLSNVLVAAGGQAKLVDFGLANVGDEDKELSEAINPRTIEYAALEKLTGVERDDLRTDIFFAGCMLYHMLAGRSPLKEAGDRDARMNPARFQNITPLLEAAPDVPGNAAIITHRAMELNPERRYATPRELLTQVEHVISRLEAGDTSAEALDSGKGGPPPASTEGAGKTVMVVESEQKIQDLFRERLKAHGYRVLVISDPQRALGRFDGMEPPADCVIFSAQHIGGPAIGAFNDLSEQPSGHDVPAILLLGENQQISRERLNLSSHRVAVWMPIKMRELRGALLKLIASPAPQS